MAKTEIEWADEVWNPTTGCDTVSPGCAHCYARTMAKRLKGMGSAKYQTDGNPVTSGPGFGVAIHPDVLTAPLSWKKPRKVFVNSMSDLFHKDVPDEFIARVFAVMAATPQHTYQILTKRHGRMRSFLRDECRCGVGHPAGAHLSSAMSWAATPHNPDYVPGLTPEAVRAGSQGMTFDQPMPNVWLGVSVEDQKRADLRIPALLDTPAAVRFLSCEPLLGPVDISLPTTPFDSTHVDWVIVGGESGPGARPMHPAWVRSLRDQCNAAGVPFFFKQWGEWAPEDVLATRHGAANALYIEHDGSTRPAARGARGEAVTVQRNGKKATGRKIDGREWNEYPAASA